MESKFNIRYILIPSNMLQTDTLIEYIFYIIQLVTVLPTIPSGLSQPNHGYWNAREENLTRPVMHMMFWRPPDSPECATTRNPSVYSPVGVLFCGAGCRTKKHLEAADLILVLLMMVYKIIIARATTALQRRQRY